MIFDDSYFIIFLEVFGIVSRGKRWFLFFIVEDEVERY